MNRHERRAHAARTRTLYQMKGRPGFKRIRRMFRKYGDKVVLALMYPVKPVKKLAR